jgi:hypothetical protein
MRHLSMIINNFIHYFKHNASFRSFIRWAMAAAERRSMGEIDYSSAPVSGFRSPVPGPLRLDYAAGII